MPVYLKISTKCESLDAALQVNISEKYFFNNYVKYLDFSVAYK